jgi:hypothetical protein
VLGALWAAALNGIATHLRGAARAVAAAPLLLLRCKCCCSAGLCLEILQAGGVTPMYL